MFVSGFCGMIESTEKLGLPGKRATYKLPPCDLLKKSQKRKKQFCSKERKKGRAWEWDDNDGTTDECLEEAKPSPAPATQFPVGKGNRNLIHQVRRPWSEEMGISVPGTDPQPS